MEVKPKKFALPRMYIRNSRGSDATTEMNEDLSVDSYILDASTSMAVEVQDVVVDKGENGGVEEKAEPIRPTKPSKATKTPTAYNIFVKTTCEELMTTHANMTPRERYALAIQMWNDRKTRASTK